MTTTYVSTDIPDLYERHGKNLVHVQVNGSNTLGVLTGTACSIIGSTTMSHQNFIEALAKYQYDLKQQKVMDAYDSILDAINHSGDRKATLGLVQIRHLKLALKALAEYEADEDEEAIQ